MASKPLPLPVWDRKAGRLIEEFSRMHHDQDVRFSRFLDEYRRERNVPRLAYPCVYTLLHTMAHHLLGGRENLFDLDYNTECRDLSRP